MCTYNIAQAKAKKKKRKNNIRAYRTFLPLRRSTLTMNRDGTHTEHAYAMASRQNGNGKRERAANTQN